MLTIEELNDNNVLSITARGRITGEDYQQVLPEIERLLEQHDAMRFHVTLDNVTGFEAGAVWDDLKFDIAHQRHFGRAAIVGDSKWQDWATKIFDVLFPAETRFFDESRSRDAWEWVNR